MVDSENLIWRMLLRQRIDSDGMHVNISTNQLLSAGLFPEVEPVELDYSSTEQGSLNASFLEFTLGRRRNDTGDLLFQNRTLITSLRSSNRTNRTR